MAFLRGAIAEPFARPGVELCRDAIAVMLRQVRHALGLGEVLPDQAVGVFVGAAFREEAAHHTGKMGSSAMGSDLVVRVDEERFDYPGEDTFEDTFVRASCVTNPAARVQDARSEMRNFRKPVGSRCKMRGGREHLAHPRRAFGAGGPRFKSGRPDRH